MYTSEQIKAAWKLANEKGIKYFGSVGSNAKTIKSDQKTNYLTHIMYLAPSNQSGKYNVCPSASPGCAAACLFTAGHGAYESVKKARIRRTLFYFEQTEAFKTCVFDEIQKHRDRCKKLGRKAAARLNGTSDIIWERKWPELFEYFNDVQFYDYTKISQRMMPNWKLPRNYHLTFSKSETNDDEVEKILQVNPRANVTVVFDELPKKWQGRRVVSGDEHDLRPLDPKGVIVGLKAKGDAWHDDTGFVVWTKDKNVALTVKGRELLEV